MEVNKGVEEAINAEDANNPPQVVVDFNPTKQMKPGNKQIKPLWKNIQATVTNISR